MSFKCAICLKNFGQQSSVKRHMREVHKEDTPNSYDFDQYNNKCLEEGCNTSFRNIAILREHLKSQHNIEFEVEDLNFKLYQEFESWKESICALNKVAYLRCKIKNHYYYNCYRSGKSKVRNMDRVRRFRYRGSCKIGCACTSQIILSRNSEGYNVTFYKTHYGHDLQMEHNRVPENIKNDVINKLINNVPIFRIVNELEKKNSVSEFLPLYRINRKLVTNIRSSYLNFMKKNHEKAISSKYKIILNSLNSWVLKSKREEFTVQKLNNCQNKSPCKFFCYGCNSCCHEYKCSCEGIFCKHIHYTIMVMDSFAKAKPLSTTTQTFIDKSNSQEINHLNDHNYSLSVIELEISAKADSSLIKNIFSMAPTKEIINDIEMLNMDENQEYCSEVAENNITEQENKVEMIEFVDIQEAIQEETENLNYNLGVMDFSNTDSKVLEEVFLMLKNINKMLNGSISIENCYDDKVNDYFDGDSLVNNEDTF